MFKQRRDYSEPTYFDDNVLTGEICMKCGKSTHFVESEGTLLVVCECNNNEQLN